MTTGQNQANLDNRRSYDVRRTLPGYVNGHDWHASRVDRPVYVVARRSCMVNRKPEHGGPIVKGERIQLISTSNAGFQGITGLGRRNGQYIHLGSLGAYDVA